MNRSKFAVLSALVMFLKDANSRHSASAKRGGIESLIADLVEVNSIDVEVSGSSESWKDDRSVDGLSSATKSRALNDLLELGILKKEYGRYKVSAEFKPEQLLNVLGDSDE